MTMKPIEHVVLLMLENRSFDSMLGWLYEKNKPAQHIPPLAPGARPYEGLQDLDLGKFENADETNAIRIKPTRGAQGLAIPNVAPGEEFERVTTQLFDNEKASGQPNMRGYVRDYVKNLKAQGVPDDQLPAIAGQVMQSYTPAQLPVLNGLAEHYAVCDAWFSSVPSQTNTNRAFAMCGTSMGLVNNGFLEDKNSLPLKAIEKISGELIGDDRFQAKTIFNALEESKATWKIFRESGYLPVNFDNASVALRVALMAIAGIDEALVDPILAYVHGLSSMDVTASYTHRLFPKIQDAPNANAHFDRIDAFFSAAENGRLPAFSYIEPEWSIAHQATGNAFSIKNFLYHEGHDYHPPGNLCAGENLVQRVYESLIANKEAWDKTLFIITFDEPVGSFDHVPPPAATPPWGKGEPPVVRQNQFNFDRFGGRVPAILVSPLIEKGTVFRSTNGTPFDHTSILSSVLKWRGIESRIPEFGERTKAAPSFENVVTRTTPRTDARDVRFMQIERKAGEPVRFYDRFRLRNAAGQYVSSFREHMAAPIGSIDPQFSEYFPTLRYSPAVNLYFQNAGNRPDEGAINSGAYVKVIGTEYGIGAYNVLGNWADSNDCYYFNDYVSGTYAGKQTWTIDKADGSSGPIRFGDKVILRNDGKQLGFNYSNLFSDYYLSMAGENTAWTVVPVTDDAPTAASIEWGDEVFLKHVQSGKSINPFQSNYGQWKPTLGSGERTKLTCSMPYLTGRAPGAPMTIADGDGVALVSKREALDDGGVRCDNLFSGSRTDLYYYYADYDPSHSTWVFSLASGGGVLQDGSQLRIRNKATGQALVPNGDFLTTSSSDGAETLWVVEKVVKAVRATRPPTALKLVSAAASSQLSGLYNGKPQTAERLLDGPNENGTFWNSDDRATSSAQWFSVELASTSIVAGLTIQWGQARATRYRVLCSLDGKSWTDTGVSKTVDKGAELQDHLPGWATPTRFIRVEMNESAYGAPGYYTTRWIAVNGAAV